MDVPVPCVHLFKGLAPNVVNPVSSGMLGKPGAFVDGRGDAVTGTKGAP